MYLLIESTSDGLHFQGYPDDKISKVINDLMEGEEEGNYKVIFVSDISKWEPDYCADNEHKVLLVKGEIVVPQQEQVVTKWKVP